MKDFFKLILLLFLCPQFNWSQVVDLPLTISDNAGNTKELRYGLDPSATDGIDNSLGEASLPPLPPAGSFDARFNLPNTESTWKDYREGGVNYSGVKIHEIQFQIGSSGTAITISWNMSGGVNGRLQDIITGSYIDIQMSGTGSYTVNNPSAFNKLKVTFFYFNIRIFLQGCYSSALRKMKSDLNTSGYIPLHQPYNVTPWNYYGTESVSSVPSSIVDWVLLEIRTSPSSSAVARKAAFLLTDGMIVGLDGCNSVQFSGLAAGNYYIVVRHRNHLSIMSSTAVYFSQGRAQAYDFTGAQNKAYGSNPMKNLGNGKFGMIAGDIDGDGNVDYSSDLLIHWLPKFGFDGYYSEDINLNGTVDYNEDLLIYWLPNFGFSSQVP